MKKSLLRFLFSSLLFSSAHNMPLKAGYLEDCLNWVNKHEDSICSFGLGTAFGTVLGFAVMGIHLTEKLREFTELVITGFKAEQKKNEALKSWTTAYTKALSEQISVNPEFLKKKWHLDFKEKINKDLDKKSFIFTEKDDQTNPVKIKISLLYPKETLNKHQSLLMNSQYFHKTTKKLLDNKK